LRAKTPQSKQAGPARLRIVAGSARGRWIKTLPTEEVRPTSNLVREATFNVLASMGVLQDANVLDLFAGSGALGIEALSRGAQQAVFVESNPRAARLIQQNLEHLGFNKTGRVVSGDAMSYVRNMAPVDVTFCDPPYDFDRWDELLTQLPSSLIIIEANHEIDVKNFGELVRHKRYGGTFVSIISTMPSSQTE